MQINLYIYIDVSVAVCVCVSVSVYVYLYMYMYVYVYVYVYAYAYAYVYVYVCIDVPNSHRFVDLFYGTTVNLLTDLTQGYPHPNLCCMKGLISMFIVRKWCYL